MPFSITPRRTAAAVLVLAVAGAAAAQAASAPTPQAAAGTAGSEVTLLDLSVAGHPISVGRLSLGSAIGSGTATAVPGLSVPAPTVELLSSTTSTGVNGDFGTARNIVHALKLTIPALTIPTTLQKPLAGLAVKSVGDLLTQPLSIAVGTMTDTVSFRPAVGGSTGVVPPTQNIGSTPTGSVPVASTPSDTTPFVSTPTDAAPNESTPNAVPTASGPQQLPRTGLGEGAGLLALGLCGAGMFLYRRNAVV